MAHHAAISRRVLMARWLVTTHLQVGGVDFVNDLQVARQHVAEHVHRPALQRLGQHCVVCVAKRAAANVPRLQDKPVKTENKSNFQKDTK